MTAEPRTTLPTHHRALALTATALARLGILLTPRQIRRTLTFLQGKSTPATR
ncbi:hypothetical protein [Streptomyces aureocirculatus]|uniref:hypothetical protein n=1 Tax=Streptomyces aureocirculatus TaxID=67275 RepID=UPI000AB3A130|nr:hypothetical protein [Streptomyces aureocirculatus]